MGEKWILLDAAISKHVKISSTTPERKGDPRILIRYLDRSNQIAVDTDDCGVRNALLTITQLPINGKPTQFQAYEAIARNHIRGIIYNAGGMTATELKANLHCRKCEIISARLIGEKGTALVTTEPSFQDRTQIVCESSFPFQGSSQCLSELSQVGTLERTMSQCKQTALSERGGKQQDSSGECPKNTPKCRNCGGSHLATARNCPKRVEINKKLTTGKSPADAKRNQRSGPKRDQGLLSPSLEGRSRMVAVRRSADKASSSAPSTTSEKSLGKLVDREEGTPSFADAVKSTDRERRGQERSLSRAPPEQSPPLGPTTSARTQPTAHSHNETPQSPFSATSSESSNHVLQTSQQPQPQPDYEAVFLARLAQLESNIMTRVQTMIERAI
ncbi:hypothetical protein HPB48_002462 [Haemaphysalis longicornis]|uniref:Uncharacterized protein n=1 Tax=Haemaphysalis longicornis TaxID=44386 RepID=A0A9J6FVZ7_HAELO|nr:hypothetical protein HPB48_002462 [Haemaphysalis longicornis]